MDKPLLQSENPLKNHQGRTLFETLLVTIFIGIFLFVAIERLLISIRQTKEVALAIELSNIRRAVGFYMMTKGKLPDSLKQLVKEQIVVPKQDVLITLDWSYIRDMSLDNEGYILDPFGNRFLYDPKTGRVRAGTKGYELW
jgi:competence protein ComGC